jgi:hypothetical protein
MKPGWLKGLLYIAARLVVGLVFFWFFVTWLGFMGRR